MANYAKALVFVAMCFAISWTAFALSPQGGADGLFILGPPVAALICAMLFDRYKFFRALGLTNRPSRWWLAALTLAALNVLYVALASSLFGWTKIEVLPDLSRAAAGVFRMPVESSQTGWGKFVVTILVVALILTVQVTLAEEIGWRGYFYRQTRRWGFWRCSLATGLVWGIWYWPTVWFAGHAHDDHRLAAMAFVALDHIARAPLMTLLRDRGRSVWAPGIYQGVVNTAGILLIAEISKQEAPAFAQLLMYLPIWASIELYRRRWPDRKANASARRQRKPGTQPRFATSDESDEERGRPESPDTLRPG